MGRTETEINRLMGQRYDMTGTAQEIGAKKEVLKCKKLLLMLHLYLNLTSPDTRFRGTPREFNIKSNEEILLIL